MYIFKSKCTFNTLFYMIETARFSVNVFNAINRNTLKVTNFIHFSFREQILKNSTIR